jgi:hypothetical protein
MYEFLKQKWVAAAGFMSGALLVVFPVIYDAWSIGLLLIFLHSPAYMIHQVEEHHHDRFRSYVNISLCGGREGLTTGDVITINVLMVWGINLAALYIAHFGSIGWALLAPYLLLVNAVSHIGWAIKFRSYNPGLGTSLLLFLPLGGAALAVTPATSNQHLVGLGIAIALHAAIILNLVWRLRAQRPGA